MTVDDYDDDDGSFMGSKSCPSSMDIIGLRVLTRKLRQAKQFDVILVSSQGKLSHLDSIMLLSVYYYTVL